MPLGNKYEGEIDELKDILFTSLCKKEFTNENDLKKIARYVKKSADNGNIEWWNIYYFDFMKKTAEFGFDKTDGFRY